MDRRNIQRNERTNAKDKLINIAEIRQLKEYKMSNSIARGFASGIAQTSRCWSKFFAQFTASSVAWRVLVWRSAATPLVSRQAHA